MENAILGSGFLITLAPFVGAFYVCFPAGIATSTYGLLGIGLKHRYKRDAALDILQERNTQLTNLSHAD